MESIEYPMIEEPPAPIQPNYAAPQQMTEEQQLAEAIRLSQMEAYREQNRRSMEPIQPKVLQAPPQDPLL